jgi:MOSC domain-containing protein YiiM
VTAARVVAVAAGARHGPLKPPREEIRLLEGLGVEGDAHLGQTVQHRSRKRWNPTLPNLRQVHLIATELLDELAERGFTVTHGQMGENVTTAGVDLLALPVGARLTLGGDGAEVEITGLRNPCRQLDGIQPGLMAATLDRDADGGLIRRAGVMGIVRGGGVVRLGDPIAVALPEGERMALGPV